MLLLLHLYQPTERLTLEGYFQIGGGVIQECSATIKVRALIQIVALQMG